MTYRNLFVVTFHLWMVVSGVEFVLAQDTEYVSHPGSYFEAPIQAPACTGAPLKDEYDAALECPAGLHDAWLKDVTRWRMERRIRIGYDDARYALPALRWTQSSFMQPQMMIEDRYFYDPVAGRYTVDRYLDDLVARYGGIDSVLIWHTYPNLGIDDRNQLDMIGSMPGGVSGVKAMVADFHRRGVRVLFPMMMWDQGTHTTQGSRGRMQLRSSWRPSTPTASTAIPRMAFRWPSHWPPNAWGIRLPSSRRANHMTKS